MDNQLGLLYSKEIIFKYPVTNHNGKEYLKENVYVCMYIHIYVQLKHFSGQQKLTDYKSTASIKKIEMVITILNSLKASKQE